MKKIFCLVLSIVLLASNYACAETDNSSEVKKEIKTVRDAESEMDGFHAYFTTGYPVGYAGEYLSVYDPSDCISYCMEKLAEFGVINNEQFYNLDDSEQKISRREIFELVYPIKEEYIYDDAKVSTKEEISDIVDIMITSEDRWWYFGTREEFDFDDIPYESEDYIFSYKLYAASLLRGTEKDGKKYARLDDYATYGEALTIICRLFWANPNFREEDMVSVMKEMGYTENFIYHFAEKVNLINSDNLFDVSTPIVSLDKMNEQITKGEFYWLLYRALYVPLFSTPRIGRPHYYINDYIVKND